MLTHSNTLLPFMVIHVIGSLAWFFGVIDPVFLIISLAAHLAVLAYGSAVPAAGFFIAQRTRGAAGTVALTYDDGPVPGRTEALLDLLREEGVTATFFCIGERIERSPELARRIIAEGHSIGVHTQRHLWWWGFMSSSRALKEIQECISTIQLVTGCEPQLFRPPFGVTSPNTANAIHQSGLETVAWDLRTFDTVSRADNSLVERTLGKLEHSSIVLLHDTAPGVIPATKAIIERARERGTILVRL